MHMILRPEQAAAVTSLTESCMPWLLASVFCLCLMSILQERAHVAFTISRQEPAGVAVASVTALEIVTQLFFKRPLT